MAIDPNSLPRDAETLQKIVVDLAEQLDRSLAEQNKYQSLLRELLEAQRNCKRKVNPLPTRTTMTSMAMPEPGRNRT